MNQYPHLRKATPPQWLSQFRYIIDHGPNRAPPYRVQIADAAGDYATGEGETVRQAAEQARDNMQNG